MTSTCWASVRGTALRATALNSCCTPVTNACGVVVTTGFVSVVVTQENDAATVIKLKSANDKVCVYDPGCDSLLDLSVVIDLCQVNPDLITMMTGQAKILDFAGNAVGFRRSTDLACNNRYALEVWTDIPNAACVGTPPTKQYGYYLLPCLRNSVITGPITIDSSNAITVQITAKTTIPSLWGTGPQTADNAYKVVPIDSSNTAGYLLVPIGTSDHDNVQLTSIAPPVIPANCGCTALTITGSAGPQLVRAIPNAALAAAGGKAIELLGSYFTGATSVLFGVTPATNFVVADDLHIEAVYPAKAAGTYPVTVVTPAGTSNPVNVTFV